MHNAITAGVVPVVAELLTSERLALSRDTYGATPLHKAVLFYQPKLVKLIADKFRIATRAKDQVLAGLLFTAFTRTTEMAKSESHVGESNLATMMNVLSSTGGQDSVALFCSPS